MSYNEELMLFMLNQKVQTEKNIFDTTEFYWRLGVLSSTPLSKSLNRHRACIMKFTFKDQSVFTQGRADPGAPYLAEHLKHNQKLIETAQNRQP